LSATLANWGEIEAQNSRKIGGKKRAADKYGDWIVNKEIEGVQIANTTNSEGSTFGTICITASNACDAYVASNLWQRSAANWQHQVKDKVNRLNELIS